MRPSSPCRPSSGVKDRRVQPYQEAFLSPPLTRPSGHPLKTTPPPVGGRCAGLQISVGGGGTEFQANSPGRVQPTPSPQPCETRHIASITNRCTVASHEAAARDLPDTAEAVATLTDETVVAVPPVVRRQGSAAEAAVFIQSSYGLSHIRRAPSPDPPRRLAQHGPLEILHLLIPHGQQGPVLHLHGAGVAQIPARAIA